MLRYAMRVGVPLVLIALLILILVGCIPIPATQQFQPDMQLRPETLVGDRSNQPVHPGKTRIEDAFIVISKNLGPLSAKSIGLFGNTLTNVEPFSPIFYRWHVSTDRRKFAAVYSIRKTTWLMPFCFTVVTETGMRWLVLDVDENGFVIRASSTDRDPVPMSNRLADWLVIFDEPARRKIQAEGLMPTDDILSRVAAIRRRGTTRRAASTRSETTTGS